MFMFLFGLFWTAFSVFMLVFSITSAEPFAVSFILIFVIIGIIMLAIGIKKLVKDYKTHMYGVECYGRVLNIKPTGSYVNERPEYQAEILTYVESENTCKHVWEIIGFDRDKYPINSYVKLKYYEGDINFIDKLDGIEQCSYNAQYYLKEEKNNNVPTDIQTTDVDGEIIVDGVKYRRVDEIYNLEDNDNFDQNKEW